jgi:amidase
MRDEDFARQQEIAATLSGDDIRDRAAVARGATLLHRAWGNANEARTKLRYTWHEFFKRFDVLLTPVAATAAFPYDRNPNRDERTVKVNGMSVPDAEQLCYSLRGSPASHICRHPLRPFAAGLLHRRAHRGHDSAELTWNSH